MNKPLLNIALLLLVIALGFLSCTPQSVPQKTEVIDYTYEDDLTRYRPLFKDESEEPGQEQSVIANEPLKISYDITEQLNAVADSMIVKNDSIRTVDGYTILVYSGNNELQAGRVRNRLFDLVPEWEAKFSYKLPTYFVKVGQFYQQIEAQALYKKIRSYYPTASIVPEKFPIEND
ncbi:hypothetical protein [Roseivirga sp.]|uniref:hypothetical protein n=1 Tax=Roseivirga sp. TaxID=1964215 RepID=UPI003B5182EE